MNNNNQTEGVPVNEHEVDRYNDLINKFGKMSTKIYSGQNHSPLFTGADEDVINAEFNTCMSDLQFLVEETDSPIQSYSIKPMQCIEYDEQSEYNRRNPNSKPKDNWWSYLVLGYNFKGQIVHSNTIAVFGCFLDVHERTKGKLKDSYAKTVVNVYIPTNIYSTIHKNMVNASEFDQFAQGTEIIDHAQGLTSFLCQKANKENDLQIFMYRAYYDDDDDPDHKFVIGYDRPKIPMPTLYQAAKQDIKHQIVGGVAFLKFGLGFGSEPGAYDPKSTLGPSILPDVKVKLLGFHGFNFSGDVIKQITYSKQHSTEY